MFDQAKAQAVCERVAAGEPLAIVCRDEGMPTDRTIRTWIAENQPFAADIARARESGYDVIAAKTRLIARGKDESTADVTRDRLIVETDLKLLARWDPKRYGDRIQSDVDLNVKVTLVNPFQIAQVAPQAALEPAPALEPPVDG